MAFHMIGFARVSRLVGDWRCRRRRLWPATQAEDARRCGAERDGACSPAHIADASNSLVPFVSRESSPGVTAAIVLFGVSRSSIEGIPYARGGVMKYVMLIYQGSAPLPGSEAWAALPEDEQKQIYADYGVVNQTPGVTPGVALGLPDNATTVRVQDGKTLITDGPFVAVKEALGGFFILEADDLDAAIEVATRVPAVRLGGAIEIRPSEVYW